MFDEAISLISMCSSMNSWLTPTVLFLLLNLMIGTIAFTSAFTSPKPTTHLQPHDQPSFHHHHHQQQPPLHLHQQHHQQILQPLLSRSSSVLQRIKSINFSNLYNFSSHPPATHFQPDPEPEPEHEQTNPQPAAAAAAEDDDSPSLEEVYSRIKQKSQAPHYGRQNSDTKPSGGEVPVKLPKKMKKSASHKSAFNHFQIQTGNNKNNNNQNRNVGVNREFVETVEEEERESEVKEEREDAGVDAKADDFINRFKKQLQLQRDESIVRYKKMISRISAQ